MSVFIIRNKETLEQWVASSGKRSWSKPNHAKAAFANSRAKTKQDPLLKDFVANLRKYESLKFNNQDVYEVVELYTETERRSAEIERKLIKVKVLLEETDLLPKYSSEEDWFVTDNVGSHLECLKLISDIKEIING